MGFLLQITEIHPNFEIQSKKISRIAIESIKFQLIEVPLSDAYSVFRAGIKKPTLHGLHLVNVST